MLQTMQPDLHENTLTDQYLVGHQNDIITFWNGQFDIVVCCIMISYSLDDDSNITEEHTASIFRVTSEDKENMFLQNTSTNPHPSRL